MVDGVPVAWLAEGARDAAPSEEARRELAAWAKARGVELSSPRTAEGRGTAAATLDSATVETVEQEIAHVRDALAGLEFDTAERALARAEAALRDRAELPQAAWLRAEVERAWSARWLRGGDEERAKRAWQRAAGLDGGREPGLGEKAFEAAAPIRAVIRLLGAGARANGERSALRLLRLDGVIAPSGEVKRSEGEHALAIVDGDGRALWAEWVTLAEGGVVRVEAPSPPGCSEGDLSRARLIDGTIRAEGVRCGAWVAAVADASGAVRIATCEEGGCTAFVEWRSITSGPAGWTFGPVAPVSPERESHSKWPVWATWTLVGIGVAGAAVGIAAAAGAFKSSAPGETQFVNGGIVVPR